MLLGQVSDRSPPGWLGLETRPQQTVGRRGYGAALLGQVSDRSPPGGAVLLSVQNKDTLEPPFPPWPTLCFVVPLIGPVTGYDDFFRPRVVLLYG